MRGAPIAVKDIIYTKGMKTTAGSKILENFVPTYDATIVAKLKKLGAVVIGKTNTHEFALGSTSINPHYGWVRNPNDPARISGGSSGGSAVAVAAGMSLAALGTDTRGSVRIPASLCGVTGFKPSFGAISKYGVFPLSGSLDHVGFLTRCVEDSRLLFNSLVGVDPKDDSTRLYERSPKKFKGLGNTVCGVNNYFLDELDFNTAEAFYASVAVLKKKGVKIVQIEIPFVERVQEIYEAVRGYESASVHEKYLSSDMKELYGKDVRIKLEAGRRFTSKDYQRAQGERAQISKTIADSLSQVDTLIAPTTPVVAPKYEEAIKYPEITEPFSRNTAPFDVTGMPAISIPNGKRGELPSGLQMTGPYGADEFVLTLASNVEQALVNLR